MNELDWLMKLVGESTFVLIGQESHGTHAFYKTRMDLVTLRLIEEKRL